MTDPGLLSIVIPVYNEEDVLPALRTRLDDVMASLGMRSEVVLVDDGSNDRSVEVMRGISREDSRYRVLVLSRNYGHQIALTAGLDHAQGDATVILDADLQDPPELIPAMLAKWREGHHVVYGKRTVRMGESVSKRLSAWLFYWLLQALSGAAIPRNVGDFRLMDRKVVQALRQMPEHSRFLRGMVSWVGYRQVALEYERQERAAGHTKYPLRKMVRFALDAVFSFSVIPLRMATVTGLLITALSVLEILRVLYQRFIENSVLPGFSPILISVLFLGGCNLLFLGVIGEYIGRIYMEAKGRPQYLVEEVLTQGQSEPPCSA
jgi:glycosyltransferase involved in cell wall biosynthesis